MKYTVASCQKALVKNKAIIPAMARVAAGRPLTALQRRRRLEEKAIAEVRSWTVRPLASESFVTKIIAPETKE